MLITELKFWLFFLTIPGLCYLAEAAQIHSQEYHDTLIKYMKTEAPRVVMDETAGEISSQNQSILHTGIFNLTVYYLLHPETHEPNEIRTNN
jgi:hypothetical protein